MRERRETAADQICHQSGAEAVDVSRVASRVVKRDNHRHLPLESCSFSFRLLIDSRLRRSRLDIGQIKLGEVERQLVANLDGTGLIVPTGVWTIAASHFQSKRCGPYVSGCGSFGYRFQYANRSKRACESLKVSVGIAIADVDLGLRLVRAAAIRREDHIPGP